MTKFFTYYALFALFLAAVVLVAASQQQTTQENPGLINKFKKWVSSQRLSLSNFASAFATFSKNVKAILSYNKRIASTRTGPQAVLSDKGPNVGMSAEQFRATRLGSVAVRPSTAQKRALEEVEESAEVLASSVDWRSRMQPIRHQGTCKSCWAFAAIATVEAALAIKKGKSVKLSEQMVVDCSDMKPNRGCSGGTPWSAYSWSSPKYSATGFLPESSYRKYNGSKRKCSAKGTGYRVALSPVKRDANSVAAFIQKNGPISAAVDAGSPTWRFYSSGVIRANDCSKKVNHAINIVGFTTVEGLPVWIIRNSWGTTWGMKGYAYLERGSNNACGIFEQVMGVKIL